MNTILITGAGSGIGAATARTLAQRKGSTLILMGRRLEPLGEVLSSLPASEKHVVVSMDVSKCRIVGLG